MEEVDRLNIYWAAMEARRRAVEALPTTPAHVLVDGKRLIAGCRIPLLNIIAHKPLLTDDIVPRAAASSNSLPPPWWAKRAAIRDPAGKAMVPLMLQGIAQNVARLFFHAAAVPSRAAFRPRGL